MSRQLEAEKKELVLESDMQRALLRLDIERLKRRNYALDAGLGLAELAVTLKRLLPSSRE